MDCSPPVSTVNRPTAVILASAILVAFTLISVVVDWSGQAAHAETGPPPLDEPFSSNFILYDPPIPAPQQGFTDLAKGTATLQQFAGRVVLVNFWATWCAPCIREMPELDELQARLGAEGLTVIALSNDRAGARVVAPFVERLGLEHLAVFLDPKGTLAEAFGVRGLPTTFLIDRQGFVVGALTGIAPWAGPEADRLIRHYLDAPPGPQETGG